jgi:hypothetical protein
MRDFFRSLLGRGGWRYRRSAPVTTMSMSRLPQAPLDNSHPRPCQPRFPVRVEPTPRAAPARSLRPFPRPEHYRVHAFRSHASLARASAIVCHWQVGDGVGSATCERYVWSRQ